MISATTQDARELIHHGGIALSEASQRGIGIDIKYLNKAIKIQTARQNKSKQRFTDSKTGKLWKKHYPHNFNLQADDQLRDILFDKLKVSAVKTTKRKSKTPSVDKESLVIIQKDIPDLKHLTEVKKIKKIKDVLIGFHRQTVDGLMHPGFPLNLVDTFRSSSRDPNFQNIPNRDPYAKKVCRQAIIPKKGHHIVTADYAGIEVNVGACVHHDPKMLKYCRFPDKNNMHTDMAIQLFLLDKWKKIDTEKMLRKGTKNGFVFPQFYGDYYVKNAKILAMWAKLPPKGKFSKEHGDKLITGLTLGEHLIKKGITNYSLFENHIKQIEDHFWNTRFKGYRDWKTKNTKEYHEKGYLQTITGFICRGLLRENQINNYPIQGSAFHCLLKSFIQTNLDTKKMFENTRLIGQIHDEMVFDVHPDNLEDLKALLKFIVTEWLPEQWKWIIVPMELEVNVFDKGAHWASKSETVILRK